MPFIVVLTASEAVGDSRPADVWARRIEATLRPSVDALSPASAREARNNQIVSGEAGSQSFQKVLMSLEFKGNCQ